MNWPVYKLRICQYTARFLDHLFKEHDNPPFIGDEDFASSLEWIGISEFHPGQKKYIEQNKGYKKAVETNCKIYYKD